MLGLVLFIKYISASMIFKYVYSSDPNISFHSSFGMNGSVSFSKAPTTIGVLAE
jgi:hypothetical protein